MLTGTVGRASKPCPTGYECVDGKCVQKSECKEDKDCQEGQECKDGKCVKKQAPDDQQPPPAEPPIQIACDTTTKQSGNKPETFIVELGQKSGTFIFTYNMYTVPDQMLVEYEGEKLFDTGCTGERHGQGKGADSKSITYSGASTKVTVKVLPACEGSTTQWTFTANCPK